MSIGGNMKYKKDGSVCLICGSKGNKGVCFKCSTEIVKNNICLVKQNYFLPDFFGRRFILIDRDTFSEMNFGKEFSQSVFLVRPSFYKKLLKAGEMVEPPQEVRRRR
jgi:hypothetical protein